MDNRDYQAVALYKIRNCVAFWSLSRSSREGDTVWLAHFDGGCSMLAVGRVVFIR
jgi:hypothetical protein